MGNIDPFNQDQQQLENHGPPSAMDHSSWHHHGMGGYATIASGVFGGTMVGSTFGPVGSFVGGVVGGMCGYQAGKKMY